MMDVMDRPPARAAPRGYFGELLDPATYKAMLYHLLSVPLAAMYFGVLVAGLAAGVGLLVVVVGVAVLLATLWLVTAFADLERALGTGLLNVRLQRARRPLSLRPETVWDWLRATLADAGTYKALLYLLLKLPFSLFMLALGGGLIGASLGLIALPFIALLGQPGWTLPHIMLNTEGTLGFTPVTYVVGLLCGVALLVFSLSLLNTLSKGWAFLSVALLTDFGEGAAAQREVQALRRSAASVAYSGDLATTLDELLTQGLSASAAGGALLLQGGAALAQRGFTPETVAALPGLLAGLGPPEAGRVRLSHPALSEQAGTLVSLGLDTRAERLGELHALYPRGAEPSRRELELWSALADQAAVAIWTEKLLERAGTRAADAERARLARDLHDSVAQALYGIALGAKTARAQLDRDPGKAGEALDYTLQLAEGAASEMKSLLFALRPDALEEGGLSAALTRLAEMLGSRYRLAASLDAPEEPELEPAVKGALYRIAQEAAHNAVKHAGASRVDLSLRREGPDWLLGVQDDGQGFDPAGVPGGTLGLKSMKERADLIGASLELHSQRGAGTSVRVRLPAPREGALIS